MCPNDILYTDFQENSVQLNGYGIGLLKSQ